MWVAGPAHGATVPRRAGPRAAAFVIGYYPHSIGGNDVTIELLTDDDETHHVRVCTAPYDDGPAPIGCATSPRGGGATFADGSTLALRL